MGHVKLEHVTKLFDSIVVVDDFNLSIDDKIFVVLVGLSGCGKSTVLRMFAGLEDVSRRRLFIDEHLLNDVPSKDRDIAMVFQNFALYPHMSVFENLAFGLKMRKYEKVDIDSRVKEAADILGIGSMLQRKTKALWAVNGNVWPSDAQSSGDRKYFYSTNL